MTQDDKNEVTQGQPQPGRPKWLVMIYLAGDNNLSANSVAIMQELEAALPPSDEVRVLACFDSNTPRPRGARYLEINHRRRLTTNTGIRHWELHNDLVPFEELPGHPVVTPDFCNTDLSAHRPLKEPTAKEGLSRFLTYALNNHQADKHMLILFGHGTAVGGKTFLADDNPPSFLRLRDFAAILSRHFDARAGADKPALDVLACHNCAMNGVELAHQIKDQVRYLLGSQSLMLAVGWPFRKIIEEVVALKDADAKDVAVAILKKCARNLIDFSLMDRSSEQAVLDLTRLGGQENLVTAARNLAAVIREGLEVNGRGNVIYPAIRDAVRMARLEAQSYWGETFVDLYDFCLLLLEQCNQAISGQVGLFLRLNLGTKLLSDSPPPPGPAGGGGDGAEPGANEIKEALLRSDPGLRLFESIAKSCQAVMREIKGNKFVVESYYVGPELQYSNGVSVYFPWCLPEGPIIFEPVGADGAAAGSSYGISWSSLDQLQGTPVDYVLKTAFDEYREYAFAKDDAGGWAALLDKFFRATLREVRRFEFDYVETTGLNFFDAKRADEPFVSPASVGPQKSGSDTGIEDFAYQTVKNYPRRFYVSPADCLRRCDLVGPGGEGHNPADDDKEFCASYLGWNVRGVVAEVIGLEPRSPAPKAPAGADGGPALEGKSEGQPSAD